jgi:hypothetical protein
MPALINELIDKVDNVEIVRDQIAAILKVELANQALLSSTPALRVFSERSNPWGMFIDADQGTTPILNVWFDSASYDGSASNIVERQKADATYNIDCYACGTSVETLTGHSPGDEIAVRESQRAARLARNILMSAHYVYLGLRGLVWKRWPQTLTSFQPQSENRQAQRISATRLALQVQFNEFSPQVVGQELETLSVEVFRAGTGELLLAAEYPPT